MVLLDMKEGNITSVFEGGTTVIGNYRVVNLTPMAGKIPEVYGDEMAKYMEKYKLIKSNVFHRQDILYDKASEVTLWSSFREQTGKKGETDRSHLDFRSLIRQVHAFRPICRAVLRG
ncbi:unnamed protein product [Lepidochelys olivacea]